jgi:UDPglucose 6-dehydrogenase
MKITIIGSGYVGLVTGACLAEMGNHVLCFDVDSRKIDMLKSGNVPIYEPGLQVLINNNTQAGRLEFTTDVKLSVAHGSLQFIAVGTPADQDFRADLQYVLAAANNIAEHMNDFKVIVNKSTVPVGTAFRVSKIISSVLKRRGVSIDFSVVSNPEFLKEGAAIGDFMRPDRIVIGTTEDQNGLRAKQLIQTLYAPFNRNHELTLFMDLPSAELTKYAANAMLATRISFMNEIANLADIVGADIEKIRAGIGSDSRIGPNFLYAGTGYGGSCFPKDVKALISIGVDKSKPLRLLEAVHDVNEAQKSVLVNKILARFSGDISGKTIAVWGLAFKPNTDDMREAPSRIVIKKLIERGAYIQAHDPIATSEAKQAIDKDLENRPELMTRVRYFSSLENAIEGADFLVIITEWRLYQSPDFELLKSKLANPIIFDGRNIFNPSFMRKFGFEYYAVGRQTHSDNKTN